MCPNSIESHVQWLRSTLLNAKLVEGHSKCDQFANLTGDARKNTSIRVIQHKKNLAVSHNLVQIQWRFLEKFKNYSQIQHNIYRNCTKTNYDWIKLKLLKYDWIRLKNETWNMFQIFFAGFCHKKRFFFFEKIVCDKWMKRIKRHKMKWNFSRSHLAKY